MAGFLEKQSFNTRLIGRKLLFLKRVHTFKAIELALSNSGLISVQCVVYFNNID